MTTITGSITKVSEVVSRGRTFVIAKDEEGRFWGIEKTNIKNGKLVKELNGLSGFMSTTFKATVEKVLDHVEVQVIMKTLGMDNLSATIYYYLNVKEKKSLGEL